MDFSLTPEQEAFLATVRAVRARARRAGRGRASTRLATFPRELVSEAAALGLLGVTIPADSAAPAAIT